MKALHAAGFMLVSCLAHSSTLKMKETCSSETSVEFKRTTRRYIPKIALFELEKDLEGSDDGVIEVLPGI
jgi:hypothetical protein